MEALLKHIHIHGKERERGTYMHIYMCIYIYVYIYMYLCSYSYPLSGVSALSWMLVKMHFLIRLPPSCK